MLLFLSTLTVASLVAAESAVGQLQLTLTGGPSEYDLAGTGWSGTGGVSLERPLTSWLRAGVGSGVFWYRTQGASRTLMLLPEAGITAQMQGAVPLYLGAGVGHSIGLRGVQDDDPTLYAALGLSLPIGRRWIARPELRVRSVDPWTGTIAGYTVGITRTLS